MVKKTRASCPTRTRKRGTVDSICRLPLPIVDEANAYGVVNTNDKIGNRMTNLSHTLLTTEITRDRMKIADSTDRDNV